MAEPQTLWAAHEVVSRRRPARDANQAAWLGFHLANARMYEYVSDVDRGHHHEALYWADYERRKADTVSSSRSEEAKRQIRQSRVDRS
ncbi:hypothetical protein OG943_23755 [Amycolatopsis sp. NBC_00345]|uniref:AMED_5909 family protein n=1 Tax=Amycolatopsis sp. NBC_00345 TaxID=2975955 RepID=UPI002E2541AF